MVILWVFTVLYFITIEGYSADSQGRNYVTINCNPELLDQITQSTWTWRLVYQDPDSLIWYAAGEDNWSVNNYYLQSPYMYNRKINFSVALFKDGNQVSGTQKDGFTAAGNAYLTLGTLVVPVTVVSQPSSRTNAIGSSTTFSVQAYGGTPLSYQWRKNNVNIIGATSDSYTIPNVSASDAGSYTCYITNPAGFRLTTASTLTVNFSVTKSFDSSKGTINLIPEKANYPSGEVVSATAVPNSGYLFKNWSGSIVSTSNPVALTMNEDKTITATFENDLNDSDGDGVSNFDEIIIHLSNPNAQDSNNDGITDGIAINLGYSPILNFTAIKSYFATNPPNGLYTTNQIIDMNMGKLMLVKNTNDQFILNYDIQHSTNLSSWSVYSSNSVILSNLPVDKSFIRIRNRE